MRRNLGFIRTKYAIIALAAAGIVVAAWAFTPRNAAAQSVDPPMPRVFSSGFITLGDGEHALIGMLLPAVQRVRTNAHISFRGPNGKRILQMQLTPPAGHGDSFFDVFFDITYHRAAGAIIGLLEIKNGKTGELLMEEPSPDGILIGLLVPAVQQNSNATVPPAGASVQLFDANHQTSAFDSFFDITY